ncbi:hypothetical protein NEIELOOT_02354 [Neisseria elongata subsp. glycolytica ATCC 29315]|uniref:Uncharacterized protein n=1 Tax=Neisseria elongata subsp. glycolytica ATCC 29315 TaxID=546263 RepID=D4DTE9_NEIEG|nr:hypothetical protein NEIELOOT_02354 [Neisseria elongata subsp. glycolytica ATCC 29315]
MNGSSNPKPNISDGLLSVRKRPSETAERGGNPPSLFYRLRPPVRIDRSGSLHAVLIIKKREI